LIMTFALIRNKSVAPASATTEDTGIDNLAAELGKETNEEGGLH